MSDLLRIATAGSVDDGKSTLIGRLLYESGAVPPDELAALARDSRRYGTRGGAMDFALLLDGLQAEREQAITIDVAHRFFTTARRHFIVADAPGHEQYLRNMLTAASRADAAVLLVDASKGILTQTRRHAYVAVAAGVRALVLAVNKMDLVGYDAAVFERIAGEFEAYARRLGVGEVTCIPLSATDGVNVSAPSSATPWYTGPALLPCLEALDASRALLDGPVRLSVQLVQRPHGDFRGYSGTLTGGRLRPCDEVVVAPSGRRTRVSAILTADGELPEAVAGQAVTVTLADAIDVVRGDVIGSVARPPDGGDRLAVTVFWVEEAPMLPMRQYLIRIGHQQVTGRILDVRHRVNVDTLEGEPVGRLEQNEIGACVLALDAGVTFDPFTVSRDTGVFIMIDGRTNATVAGGTIVSGLRQPPDVAWQSLAVERATRAAAKRQRPCVVWLTGLSGAGKSTIANLVESGLSGQGRHTYLLDGDNVRHGLNRDLGFTDEDRVENVRRVAEVAKLMADAGLIVLVSLISPFRAEREMARSIVAAGEFLEIHVDTPLEVCEARDPKGLYRRARAGLIANFTGIDSAYEPPLEPDLTLRGTGVAADELAQQVIRLLRARGVIE